MPRIRCKTTYGSYISLFGLSAILKIRCVEYAHYVQLAAASAWNREKQMFVAKEKEFDMVMYRSNRSFNMPPPPATPGHLTFLKIIVQIPPHPGQNAVQMSHTRVH